MADAVYTTVQGDTWDMICFKLFGQGGEKQTNRLVEANIDYAHQVFFPAGIRIRVPDNIRPQPRTFEGVPPWKR